MVSVASHYIHFNSIRTLSNPISVRRFIEDFIDDVHREDIEKVIIEIEKILKLKAFW